MAKKHQTDPFITASMRIGEHMEKEHPNEEFFGDSYSYDDKGNIFSHTCQLCGKELMGDK